MKLLEDDCYLAKLFSSGFSSPIESETVLQIRSHGLGQHEQRLAGADIH